MLRKNLHRAGIIYGITSSSRPVSVQEIAEDRSQWKELVATSVAETSFYDLAWPLSVPRASSSFILLKDNVRNTGNTTMYTRIMSESRELVQSLARKCRPFKSAILVKRDFLRVFSLKKYFSIQLCFNHVSTLGDVVALWVGHRTFDL